MALMANCVHRLPLVEGRAPSLPFVSCPHRCSGQGCTATFLLRFQLGKLEQMLSQYRLPVEESVPLLAPLLSLTLPEHRYPLLNLSPQRQRQKTLEALVAILLEHAEQQPVLFILEDLHWTDPTTLEFLNLLIEQIPTASILTWAVFTTEYYRNNPL